MKTMSFKIKIMLIGASIIVAIGIVLTAIFCNIYNRPTVLADSVESSVTAPSVSVAPIKDTQPPVTTTTAPDSNANVQTNAPVTTVTTKATLQLNLHQLHQRQQHQRRAFRLTAMAYHSMLRTVKLQRAKMERNIFLKVH